MGNQTTIRKIDQQQIISVLLISLFGPALPVLPKPLFIIMSKIKDNNNKSTSAHKTGSRNRDDTENDYDTANSFSDQKSMKTSTTNDMKTSTSREMSNNNGSKEDSTSGSSEEAKSAREINNNQRPIKKRVNSAESVTAILVSSPTTDKNLYSSNKSSSKGRGKPKGTCIKFAILNDRPDTARVQLLLCNISERPLYFKLRCNIGTNVSALPSGSGHIAPKSQARLVLTWHRPREIESWSSVATPRMLLETKCMDAAKEEEEFKATTRLEGAINHKAPCNGSNPPVEQLILDAVSKEGPSELLEHETPDFIEVVRESFARLSPELQMAVLLAILFILYSVIKMFFGQNNNTMPLYIKGY